MCVYIINWITSLRDTTYLPLPRTTNLQRSVDCCYSFGTAVILVSVALIVWLHELQILLVQLQYETLPVITRQCTHCGVSLSAHVEHSLSSWLHVTVIGMWLSVVSVPDPNQPQRGSLSVSPTASDTRAGLKVWERD